MDTPEDRELIAPADRAWLRMDSDQNRMVINGFLFLEGKISYPLLKEYLGSHFTILPHIQSLPVGKYWIKHHHFSVEKHIFTHTVKKEELPFFASVEISKPLPKTVPLWQCHLIDTGADSVLFWRIHHAIGDGILLTLFMLSLMGIETEGTFKDSPLRRLFLDKSLSHKEAVEILQETMPKAVKLLAKPAEIFDSLPTGIKIIGITKSLGHLLAMLPDEKTTYKRELTGRKSVSWISNIKLAKVSSKAKEFGCTVNDIVTACVAQAIEEEFKNLKTKLADIRAVVPVNIRPLEMMDRGGNHFGLVFLKLPITAKGIKEKVAAIKSEMGKLKASLQPWAAFSILQFMGIAPDPLYKLILKSFSLKGSLVMTNVPGPAKPLYFLGHKVKDVIFWVPQAGNIGLGISIFTYNEKLTVGIIADRAIMPDAKLLSDRIRDVITKCIES